MSVSMSGVTKKFGINFPKKGTKKKNVEKDDKLPPLSSLSPHLGSLHPPRKSGSMGSINSEVDTEFCHDDIMELTNNVRSFSDALQGLKAAVSIEDTPPAEEIKVLTLDKLGEVLHILRGILQKYPILQSTDILTGAAILISKVKSVSYEDMATVSCELLYSIDQLASSFIESVTQYLMGDLETNPPIAKAKSYEHIDQENLTGSEVEHSGDPLSADEIDNILYRMDTGVETALERAKAWSRYAKDINTYIEKRTHLEMEFAKGLNKLAHSIKQNIAEDMCLPCQSIYCTAIDEDIDLASTAHGKCTVLQSYRCLEPLTSRRLEHEKARKQLRDTWVKETRRMQEAITNLKKAKSLYITRNQDWEKARETTQKAENENLNLSTGASQAKADKKKKQEDECCHKAAEAETTYKACVVEANQRQRELEQTKRDILRDARELVYSSDQVMKAVTTNYFRLMHNGSLAIPVQFEVLANSTEQYVVGSSYTEYVTHMSPQPYHPPEPFAFESYLDTELRKRSELSSGSGSDALLLGDDSPAMFSRSRDKGGDDDEQSLSGSSCKSLESSPCTSPYAAHRAMATSELTVTHDAAPQVSENFRGVALSKAAQTHVFRKLRAPARCRHCDSYVYFQGAECERCGVSSHKKCLESLSAPCGGGGGAGRRMTTFGVDFSAHVQETHTDIPHLVRQCVAAIDSHGLSLKGIYRVSGVKSKVERLCQSFESPAAGGSGPDLSEHHPNVIANVLKLYLRQLPEPLLTFGLYNELISLGKESVEKTIPDDKVLPALTALMSRLPRPNLSTLRLLVHHLRRVADNEPQNQMSATNLGIVFGPTLLRPSSGGATLDSLMDTPHQTRVVELLIQNASAVLGPDEFPPPASAVTAGEDGGKVDAAQQTADEPGSGLDVSGRSARLLSDTPSFCVPEITENLWEELAKDDENFQFQGSSSVSSSQPSPVSQRPAVTAGSPSSREQREEEEDLPPDDSEHPHHKRPAPKPPVSQPHSETTKEQKHEENPALSKDRQPQYV